MYFQKIDKFPNFEMSYISNLSKGYITKNHHILKSIDLNDLNRFILEKCLYGTPVFKLGNKGFKILIISGIHGNELPPQIANLFLMNYLYESDLENTLYFIPFASPKSAMLNERTFNSRDLNRSAHIKDSLSNQIIEFALLNKIDYIGDFHSTAYNSNPGRNAIFSSKAPSPESLKIGKFLSSKTMSDNISYDFAGLKFKGAVEDVSNLKGIPSITAEVLSPFATVGHGSVYNSFNQMLNFLKYF